MPKREAAHVPIVQPSDVATRSAERRAYSPCGLIATLAILVDGKLDSLSARRRLQRGGCRSRRGQHANGRNADNKHASLCHWLSREVSEVGHCNLAILRCIPTYLGWEPYVCVLKSQFSKQPRARLGRHAMLDIVNSRQDAGRLYVDDATSFFDACWDVL